MALTPLDEHLSSWCHCKEDYPIFTEGITAFTLRRQVPPVEQRPVEEEDAGDGED